MIFGKITLRASSWAIQCLKQQRYFRQVRHVIPIHKTDSVEPSCHYNLPLFFSSSSLYACLPKQVEASNVFLHNIYDLLRDLHSHGEIIGTSLNFRGKTWAIMIRTEFKVISLVKMQNLINKCGKKGSSHVSYKYKARSSGKILTPVLNREKPWTVYPGKWAS